MIANLVRSKRVVLGKQNGASNSIAEGFYLRVSIPALIIVKVANTAFVWGNVSRFMKQSENASAIRIFDVSDDDVSDDDW
jgi:hypothetical protein